MRIKSGGLKIKSIVLLEALKAISKDPASKVYFLNGDSPTPLPLMNLGDSLK